ncbi:MAG: YdcH family protein [Deltaproteobacteria bacterium]|nr:YdcH family protein [Deltaproteobacteria bacterium]
MESYESAVVDELLKENKEFKELFDKHKELDWKVNKLEKHEFLSKEDDEKLHSYKKEKLQLKDELERMVEAKTASN